MRNTFELEQNVDSCTAESLGDEPELQTLSTGTHDVVLRYQDMIYRLMLTHTRNRGDADDAFQEVFLAYHRKQPKTCDEEHLKAWLITTALNCARRTVTNSWRNRVVPIRPEEADQFFDEVFSFDTLEQDAVFRALSKLNEIYRSVLHLFYFEDQSVNEIAQLLGLEVGAVKMRLSRGRSVLRNQLQEDYFNE
ncbi:MAG: sigma-70 family RNA polymerase sigma factor [Propionibacteriaceae bacterium]|nr:sigma-70 family RNA polymerase sigma factor [Propionibacteriaceae bacterium]